MTTLARQIEALPLRCQLFALGRLASLKAALPACHVCCPTCREIVDADSVACSSGHDVTELAPLAWVSK